MNRKRFILIWIVLGTLILGGVLGGAYYLKLSNKNQLFSPPSSNLTLKDESLDWQEYKNQTFGYLIKFPNLYEISPQSEKQISQLGLDTNICIQLKADKVCKIVISAYKNTNNLSIEKWVQQFRPTNKIIGKVKLGNYDVLRTDGPSPNNYLSANGTIFEISSPKDHLEEKIISTFRVVGAVEKGKLVLDGLSKLLK